MVHYCSDVMAGVLVGITAGVLSYVITKFIMNFLDKNPKLGNIDLAQKLGKKKA